MDKRLIGSLAGNVLLLGALVLTGCNSNSGAAVLSAIELTECEIGEVSLTGEVKTGTNPFAQGSVFFNMREVHTVEDIPAWCEDNDND